MAFRLEKKAITLHYKKEKPVVQKLALVREQTVKYKQLVKNIAANTGIRKGEVEDVLDGLVTQMTQMMQMGHPVQLGVLGTFKPTVNTKCAKDGEELSADNIIRRKILFYPGEAFKEMLADMEIETESDSEEDDASDAPSGGGSTDDGGGDDGGGQEFT